MVKVKLTLGERIQDKMNELNLSFDDVLKETNISRTALREILTSSRENITSKNLIKLSGLLNVSVDYLLGLQEDSTTNLDLQAISNEYGISSKAMENIKKSLTLQDFSFDDIEHFYKSGGTDQELEERKNEIINKNKKYIDSLNTLLESNNLCIFLETFSNYLNFFPFDSSNTLVSFHKPFEEDNYYADDYLYNDNYESFEKDKNNMIVSPNVFNKLLLDSINDELEIIKQESSMYKNNLIKELEMLKEDLKLHETGIWKDNNSDYWVNYRNDLKSKIAKLEKKLND